MIFHPVRKFQPNRPYLAAWLKRCARELSGSGAVSQTAHRLAQEIGGSEDEWKDRLRKILSGDLQPSSDLITRLDGIWSHRSPSGPVTESQDLLF